MVEVNKELIIKSPTTSVLKAGVKIQYEFVVNGVTEKFYYIFLNKKARFTQERLNDSAAILGLLIGMKTSNVIRIEGDVSSLLLKNFNKQQDVWLEWKRDEYSRVDISTQDRKSSLVSIEGSLSPFTGGVDSFFTLNQHQDELTNLFYVYGYDVVDTGKEFVDKVRRHLLDSVSHFKVPMIEVETNLRDFSNKYINWLDYHGAAIAAVGVLLSEYSSTLYIPSTRTYSDSTPIGSHPLTDPLWSTEYLAIDHDGAGSSRVEKIANISKLDAVRDNLRVCWKSKDDINCGECEKCVRTMTALEAMGDLSSVKTFPPSVRSDQLAVPIQAHYYPYMKDIMSWIDRHGDKSHNQRVSVALRRSIDAFFDAQQEAVALEYILRKDETRMIALLKNIPYRSLIKYTSKIIFLKAKSRFNR